MRNPVSVDWLFYPNPGRLSQVTICQKKTPLFVVLLVLPAWGCRPSGEDIAARLCREADSLEAADVRGALELRRRIWEQMPTTGTGAAKACVQPIREEMGRVRLLVAEDKRGEAAAVDGCEWAVEVVEVFGDSPHPPFRIHWARRLMDRCAAVVGRAWARSPETARYADLSRRMKARGNREKE